VRHDFNNMAQRIGKSPEEIADGFIKIAVENMANAIKKISVQRGYDVTRYALNCFGGAGGQHACLVADALGMTTVLIHPFSSLLSAYGMGLADIRSVRQQAIEEPFGAKALAALNKVGARLSKDVSAEVAGQGVPAKTIKVHVRAHIRYAGTDTALVVKAGSFSARSVSPSPGGGGSARRRSAAASRRGVKKSLRDSPPPDARSLSSGGASRRPVRSQ
jgi:5-oxoprolinase (ATP-hydrolysing)